MLPLGHAGRVMALGRLPPSPQKAMADKYQGSRGTYQWRCYVEDAKRLDYLNTNPLGWVNFNMFGRTWFLWSRAEGHVEGDKEYANIRECIDAAIAHDAKEAANDEG